MALQTINVGNFANDGTGDDLRTAMIKINANFEELDLQGGQANTISNVGVGLGLYKEKIGVDLRLKTLVAGDGINITSSTNELTVTNNKNVIVKLNADTGSVTASSPTSEVSIVGGTGITTSINGNTLTITGNNYNLNEDPNPSLAGNLDLNGYNIIGNGSTIIVSNIISNLTGNVTGQLTGNVTGNVNGLVNGIDIRSLMSAIMTFDFGLISNQAETPAQWFLLTNNVDLGTFAAPSSMGIDGGSF